MPGWIGAVIRQNDKMRRLQKFAVDGNLANESVEDSLIDNIVYGIIALALYREVSQAPKPDKCECGKHDLNGVAQLIYSEGRHSAETCEATFPTLAQMVKYLGTI